MYFLFIYVHMCFYVCLLSTVDSIDVTTEQFTN